MVQIVVALVALNLMCFVLVIRLYLDISRFKNMFWSIKDEWNDKVERWDTINEKLDHLRNWKIGFMRSDIENNSRRITNLASHLESIKKTQEFDEDIKRVFAIDVMNAKTKKEVKELIKEYLKKEK